MSTRENPTTVSVSPELLAHALGLPEDARIIRARWDDVGAGHIDLDIVAEGWPECRDHVLAMCQGCHLHYDRAHHAESAARELEARGQTSLIERPPEYRCPSAPEVR